MKYPPLAREPDSPPGRDASVAASCSDLTYLNVFTVEEYERDGKSQKRWTKIGAAFPHKENYASQRIVA
jgi:hypothetical protein